MSVQAGSLTVLPGAPTRTKGPSSLLTYTPYDSDKEADYLSAIRQLISSDLSEPYSIYVYRYFLYQWGDLCFLVLVGARRA